ncbi:MAG TPA: hypothetical protein VIW92_00545 [Thermoanaerobaculia bacterium]
MARKAIVFCFVLLGLIPFAAPAQDFAGDEIELSPLGGFERVASMNARGEVLVVWAGDDIHGRLLAPDDTPLGPEFQIAETTNNYVTSLAASIDLRGFSVVWEQEKRFESSSWMRRFDAAGEPVTERMDIGLLPTVETDPRGRSVVVSWEAGRVQGQRFNVAGNPVGPPIPLVESRLTTPLFKVVVDGQGHFVVVWKTAQSELLGRRFDNGGRPRSPLFRIARSAGDFDLAGNGQGSFVALWTTSPRGLWAQAFSPSGEASRPVLVAPRVSDQQTLKVSVGMDAAGRFLATWDGTSNVFGRFFEASGTPLDAPFRVGRPPAGQHDFAADAAGGPAGQFFVTWARAPKDGLNRLMGRRLRWPGDGL